ncbi:MAG: hypothetical protein WDO73_21880 [Ignavibacteriota bacterium]
MVTCNRKYQDIFQIPEAIRKEPDDTKRLEFIASHLKNADTFLRRVHELNRDFSAKSDDVLEFKDGRIFERHSEPQLINGKSAGRVWGFRDITHRYRAQKSWRAPKRRLKVPARPRANFSPT